MQHNTNAKKKQPDSSADVQLGTEEKGDVGFFWFFFLQTVTDEKNNMQVYVLDFG